MAYRSSVRAAYDVALSFPGHPGISSRVHGHRYIVEAVLESDRLDGYGFVIDFDAFQPLVQEIASELDHRTLNEIEPFTDGGPSAERQAEFFYRRLREALERKGSSAKVVRIRVTQEPGAWAEFEPPAT